MNKLKIIYPDFVSITYGAGGSTRKRTHETIKKFTYRPAIKPIPHLTCIGDTKTSIRKIAGPMSASIIININGIVTANTYPSTLHPLSSVISIDFFKELIIPSSKIMAK